MAFRDTIVKFINDSLKAGSLNNKKLQPAAYHGLASVVARPIDNGQLQLLPAIDEGNGNYKPVEPNDKYNLVMYHKPLGNSYSFNKQSSYGDGFEIKSTSEMALIVWVDGKKTKLTTEHFEAMLVAGFPQKLTEDARKSIEVKSCLITPLATNMDKLQVFRQEYQGGKYFLKPEHIFFQLRYRVEMAFNQHCLNTCGCGPE
jgi:hypothetical protein